MIIKIISVLDIIAGALLIYFGMSHNYGIIFSGVSGWCAGRVIGEGMIELLSSKQESKK
ncbi:hypothetical protein LCGC14_1164820 [marine sediment metagenome]|uniref:Uncharacterized protein n=1 Tax=marine sediment metagenome TaxID=412755 RepID=A0A0F9PX84_9ZZZZ